MSENASRFDAIVVGAGFAGVVAARELASNHSVLVLEARDRLGGRAWCRPFANTDVQIEIGGQFVYPRAQPPLARELERYGLDVLASGFTVANPHWLYSGTRRAGGLPVPIEDLSKLEGAAYYVRDSSLRITLGTALDKQMLWDLDTSLSEFLAVLDLPVSVRGLLNHICGIYLGRYPDDASALQLLNHLALFDGSFLQLTPWGRGSVLAGGTRPLVEAIWNDAAGAGADLKLSAPVSSIEHRDDGAVVRSEDGGTYSAAVVVLAIPVNCWADVEVTPTLTRAKRNTVGHAGTPAAKYWALVEGAPDGALLVADPVAYRGVYQSAVYTTIAGAQLFAGYTVDGAETGVESREGIEAVVELLTPGGRVLAVDGYDWLRDPYAKGAWAGFEPGYLSRNHSDLSEPEGRLFFAGSDIAMRFNSWIAGAIESGIRAAEDAAARLHL
jgi:glycine/D-amino acid oxidase-like deaminating enzyme